VAALIFLNLSAAFDTVGHETLEASSSIGCLSSVVTFRCTLLDTFVSKSEFQCSETVCVQAATDEDLKIKTYLSTNS
jgi:hypothetical protein